MHVGPTCAAPINRGTPWPASCVSSATPVITDQPPGATGGRSSAILLYAYHHFPGCAGRSPTNPVRVKLARLYVKVRGLMKEEDDGAKGDSVAEGRPHLRPPNCTRCDPEKSPLMGPCSMPACLEDIQRILPPGWESPSIIPLVKATL